MMTIYTENVITDANGEATVQLAELNETDQATAGEPFCSASSGATAHGSGIEIVAQDRGGFAVHNSPTRCHTQARRAS
jgi:hypothetical protein